ncbi:MULTISPECIES: SMP-30/gluconolactonase/LRE family protein [unclassified Mycolicibacterium]|uniref:SMP-30/gluconolactonase/LRE family protein n=1 Tax=unclassified Mycolicibacterium TaxID=2636767 RepID=UPI0012DD95E6|nr:MULTISPECIES: SMP-30/gluconolactonase/LRE family protein [unclassified Mycolicibacterium]MUL84257.1 SMP-30/gluconolactonase/LRE family protein [Mycolicibacterium sp. CBMA 329]MUL89677.1 SMP-30/gluconolactonase/LRE family protein [Mycolicibacterium sp. CBMA 331]MUL99852.1 SMP-30/gluconolactonase/LRE family protein [Mycolicibacterium sp. CBMA 334]MUM27007.1 SMP-30/gluconolactonase/LRE family protein [Mycolicibacterium sp. CBMA 295]MUM39192.1 SMP-30/gluconolactonase/LRE family protein [Mycolic
MSNVLLSGRAFLEGPRWHDGLLYVSDMHGDEVLSVTEDGDVSTVVEVERPSGLGWLPDGSLLISAMERRAVLRFDGSDLTVHADLSPLAPFDINDMCVDRHGHAFVGQFGYDMWSGAPPVAAPLLRVDPDGSVHEAADALWMANGMVITPDHATLLVAESAGKSIAAFDLAPDGSLSNRRVWADLPDYPDGIGIDADGGVWVASPVSDRFIRVVEGGEVTHTIDASGRHAIACEVGGSDGEVLFMLTSTTHGGRDESRQVLGAAIETVQI